MAEGRLKRNTTMKALAIINPKSGRLLNETRRRKIQKLLREPGVEIHWATYPGHAREIARAAVNSGFETIILAGGDGTINEVLPAMAYSKSRLAIIPVGRANDLAVHYRLPRNERAALEVIRNGDTRAIDLLSVNGRYFATIGGLGMPADVIRVVSDSPRWGRSISGSGALIYLLGLGKVLRRSSKHCPTICLTDGKGLIEVTWSSLMVGLVSNLGKYFRIFPTRNGSTGRFDVCLIDAYPHAAAFLPTILSLFRGNGHGRSNVMTYDTSNLEIDSEAPLLFFGDGEILEQNVRFRIKLHPGAIRLVVPGEGGHS